MTDTQPAPTVPDEAVRAYRSAYNLALVGPTASTAVWDGLKAAAPFIVAANRAQSEGQSDLDLNAIHLRADAADRFGADSLDDSQQDVPELLAEVERLRAQRDAAVAQAEECRNYIIESGAAKLRRALAGDATS